MPLPAAVPHQPAGDDQGNRPRTAQPGCRMFGLSQPSQTGPGGLAMITRRNFLKNTARVIGGLALPLSAFKIINPERLSAALASGEKSGVRWVFLVDAYKCIGCGFCVKACKLENETPYEANVTRTWVERYVLLKDRRLFADTPRGARDGFTTGRIEL